MDIKLRSYLFCFITIIVWSTLEVVSKSIGTNISPIAITAYRFLIGGFIILPFAIIQIRKHSIVLNAVDFLKISIPGILNVTISMLLLQLSIHYGKAALSAIIISTNPIFVAFFARILLKEKLDFMKIVGISGGFIGLIVILSQENLYLAESRNVLIGVIFGILSSITFGLYTVISKKYIKQYGNVVLNSFSFIIGSFILVVVSIIFGKDLTFQLSYKMIVPLLYLGVFITGIAYLIFFEALKHISTTSGSMFFYLKPVIASILAYFTLHEQLNLIQILGIAVIILSISLDKLNPVKNLKQMKEKSKKNAN